MGFILKGRWALVTGASAGIGAALARELAAGGCNLVLVARREAQLQALARSLTTSTLQTRVIPMDLCTAHAAEVLAEQVHDLPISIVVNNAGVALSGRLENLNRDQLRKMLALNIGFLTEFCQIMVPRLLSLKQTCRILNVGSIAGNQGVPWFLPYASSKAYVNMFSEGLNWELRGTQIAVTCLQPGSTHSEFFEHASMEGTFMARFDVMDANTVARRAVAGMVRGQTRVIPGWTNKLRVLSLRLTPRALVGVFIRLMFRDLAKEPVPSGESNSHSSN